MIAMISFSLHKREIVGLAILLLGALIIRLALFPLQGYQNDLSSFAAWLNTAADNGIRPFYSIMWSNPQTAWVDYPPLNIYLFWFFGSLAHSLHFDIYSIVKVVPTIFDLATIVVIYLFLRQKITQKQSLLATALYAFNPAIIFNVAVWGQFDAVYTLFLVLSLIVALKRKPEISAVIFALALLSKPQGIALLPLVVLVIFIQNGAKRLLTSIAAFAATIVLVILPFEWSNPIDFLRNIYFGAYNNYQYTSINAFNMWGLFGLWQPDQGFYIVGWALFAAFAVVTLAVLYRRFLASGHMFVFFAAFMLLFSFFMLPTRIHERYLFPAIIMLVLLLPFAKKIWPFYIALTSTLFVNEAYVLYYLNMNAFIPNGDGVVLAVSIINLIMLLYATVLLFDEFKGKSILKTAKIEQGTARGDLPK